MTNSIFDIGKWHGKLIVTPGTFESLVDLVEHPGSIIEYKRSIGLKTCDVDGRIFNINSGPLLEGVRQAIHDNVLTAIDHYASLMVVTAATYIENILIEFFVVYFESKPNAIHAYLRQDASRREEATVSLREVLAADDIVILRAALAKRAARNAANGAVPKIFARINALARHRIGAATEIAIADIMKLRNDIVHDGNSLTRAQARVPARFSSVLLLLEELALICRDNNLPYRDDGHLISP